MQVKRLLSLEFVRNVGLRVVLIAGLAALGGILGQGLGASPQAQAHSSHPGLEFHIGVDTNGDTVDDCTTVGDAKGNCTMNLGSLFTVRGYLDSTGLTNYVAIDTKLNYSGVTSKNNPNIVSHWPDCVFTAQFFTSAFVAATCTIGLFPAPASAYTGLFYTNDFNCAASGTIQLTHGVNSTFLLDSGLQMHSEAGPDVLNINCGTDADGDGCPDANEQQTDNGTEMTGGRRNYLNPYDYFDPTNNGLIRVNDILAVVGRYFSSGDPTGPLNTIPAAPPAYHPKFDRAPLGPNVWNLTQGNGIVTVPDILAVVVQYFHDCGTGIVKVP